MAPGTEFHHRSSVDQLLQLRGYTLGECIGEGAYAKVYLAEFLDRRRNAEENQRKMQLACKMIDGNAAPRDFIQKFFPRELEIMSRINYKFCLRIHSVVQRKHLYFVFMQFCPNGDLLDFIRGNGSIRETQARIWFAQLLKALNYLESKSIAHRDLKCENILLTAAYNIKLADFGFARSMMFDKLSRTFCGSISYAAPEIVRGKPYDPLKSDIWSAGVVLFVMLNKSLPFDDTHVRKLYDCQMRRAWKFRSKVARFMSRDLKEFMFKILDPEPGSRMRASELWKLSWIQVISESGQAVTPPPSPVPSVLDRNKKYWEEQETVLLLQQHQEHIPEEHVEIQVMDNQTIIPINNMSMVNLPDLIPTSLSRQAHQFTTQDISDMSLPK